MSSVVDFIFQLASLAYDLFYPLATIAQMPLNALVDFSYINPFTEQERVIVVFGKEMVHVVTDIIGVGNVTVLEGLIMLFAFCAVSIVIVNMVKLFVSSDG